MNGPHDMGGMHNMGSIPIAENEPVFHSEWEAKVFAMSFATFANYFPVDETRHASELMPPGQYLSSRYYERWLYALEHLITEHHWVTPAEIEERIVQLSQTQMEPTIEPTGAQVL